MALVGSERQQFGSALEGVDHPGLELPRQRGDLVVAAAPPGEQCRHGQGHGQRRTQCQRGPGQDHPDGHRADDAGAHRDRHRQQGAQVEVLECVDVVDGAGQQVAAAPAGQGGRHAGARRS